MPHDRLPPQNLDAEKGLIGSVLRDNAAYLSVGRVIGQESFYSDAHRKMWELIAEKCIENKPVDLVILCEMARGRGWIEDIGGAAYIADCWDAAPTAANAEYYARIVREKAVTRQAIHACTEIVRDAYDGILPADDLVERIGQLATALGDRHGLGNQAVEWKDVIAAAMNRIDRVSGQHGGGLQAGIADLDNVTGGLFGGELVTVGARPGVGKSALAAQIAISVASAGKPTLFVTMEMNREETGTRGLIARSGVPNRRIKRAKLEPGDVEAIMRAAERMRGYPIVLSDQRNQSVREIAGMARTMTRRTGLGLIVIDYLQLLRPENPRLPRHEQVATMTRSLKNLAGELDVPILLLSQLTRGSDQDNREPRLSDLKESGAIEQDSDIVILLHRGSEFHTRHGAVDVLVAKQRNGAVGRFKLAYLGDLFKFEPWTPA
jgi:replicative DNA helicase